MYIKELFNAFATCNEIDEQNVVEIVTAGRARWKFENEGNNILKTKGYHLEHNFGYGENHLAKLLFCLNLLAYLFHTSLDLVHITYRAVRDLLVSRQTFFNDVRALTRYLCLTLCSRFTLANKFLILIFYSLFSSVKVSK